MPSADPKFASTAPRVAHFAAAVAIVACGPERGPEHDERFAAAFADGACTAMIECGCASPFADVAECKAAHVELVELLEDRGNRPDQDCLDQYLDQLADDPCLAEMGITCTMLDGSRHEGQSCFSSNGLPLVVDECGAGVTCVAGVCGPDGSFWYEKSEGSACAAEDVTSCASEDVFCSDQGVCVPFAAEGEPCVTGGCKPAAERLFCAAGTEPAGTCLPAVQFGEPCDPLDWAACFGEAVCNPSTRRCDAWRGGMCSRALTPNTRRALWP